MGKPWRRNALRGALVGGGVGAAGGWILMHQAEGAIGDPRIMALYTGLLGAGVGALIGIAWTALR